MNNLVFISIVVPVFNAAKTISECVESLLNQSLPKEKYEVIIVDNNSTDDTTKIVKQYPVTLLYEKETQTSYAARNKGIKQARGQMIAFTDADCVADKEWLKELIKDKKGEKIGGFAGEIIPFQSNALIGRFEQENPTLKQKINSGVQFLPYAVTANVAYKKEVFETIGLFDKNLISGGDVDFAWRMQLETDYKLLYIPQAKVYHKHRQTLKGLFYQNVKYAFGGVILSRRYKKEKNNFKIVFKYLSLSFYNLMIALYKYIKFTICRYKNPLFYMQHFYRAIVALGLFYGTFRGFLKEKNEKN